MRQSFWIKGYHQNRGPCVATRKQLRELGLTFQTLSASDDDEVNDLINEVNKIYRDEQGE